MGVKTYSLAKDGEVRLAENFLVGEFRCKDGSDAILISGELVDLLQKIRDHFGRAVAIHSAYRTESYNRKVGGATGSQHKLGTAADISIAGVSPLEIARYAESLQPTCGGIGVYAAFTHVDVRDSRARWDSRSGTEKAVAGWYAPRPSEAELAVKWLTENKIMLGDSGDLMLDQPLTRKQFALMLYRYHQRNKFT